MSNKPRLSIKMNNGIRCSMEWVHITVEFISQYVINFFVILIVAVDNQINIR